MGSGGITVGSVNAGSLQRGVIYDTNADTASIITQTTPDGSFFVTAFGINFSGRIRPGIDPNNAARNVGIVYDMGSAQAFEVGALPSFNGALAFGVSSAGHVVGSSMLNQGSGLPFIWTRANGIMPIPLPAGTSSGIARGVEFIRMGGGYRFLGFRDSVSLRWNEYLSPRRPSPSRVGLGFVDKHLIVGPRHQ